MCFFLTNYVRIGSKSRFPNPLYKSHLPQTNHFHFPIKVLIFSHHKSRLMIFFNIIFINKSKPLVIFPLAPLPPSPSPPPHFPDLSLSSLSLDFLINAQTKTHQPGHPHSEMDRPKFVIEASEVESMASRAGVTVVELLPSLVKSAQTLARPPISKYHVGAVGLGSSGRIFFGVNLEFPNLSLHHSVHAEQFLLTNLSINSETRLEFVVVSSTPCGHCRQFFQEVRNAPDIKIQIPSQSNEFNRLSDFLPHRFGPDDLLQKDVPLLLEPHDNGLSFSGKTRLRNLCNGAKVDLVNGFSKWDELKWAALEAANKSHAPYSGCPSGVAMMDCEGKIYRGSYAESAAYNPSLGPVQAALVHFVVGGGGGGYERLVSCVLVEKEECDVKQEHTARLLVSMVSPKCEFRVLYCN